MTVLNPVRSRPLSTLLDSVDLRGGHLYETEPDSSLTVGGEVYGVLPIEGNERLWVGTRVSSDSTKSAGIVLFERCTWREEVYLQCEKGTFGCVVIDDPQTGKQVTIHGIRLSS